MIKKTHGDFQTPVLLTNEICQMAAEFGWKPKTIFEPTCGEGNFITSAVKYFGEVEKILGVDINLDYVNHCRERFARIEAVDARQGNFFGFKWDEIAAVATQPILFLGNPPWVTNAFLMRENSDNLPGKNNIDGLKGIDAITGKSNFDISEWMIRRYCEIAKNKHFYLSVLCKTSVARKILLWMYSGDWPVQNAKLYSIDAKKYFGVTVDASILFLESRIEAEKYFFFYPSKEKPEKLFYRDGKFFREESTIRRISSNTEKRWRSGIKHDCANVLVLKKLRNGYENQLNENVQIEEELIYPFMKSSDVFNQRSPSHWLILTQKAVGEETKSLETCFPKAWRYLLEHEIFFTKRKSRIYHNKPRFSIFGIGDYSLKPWKLAISAMYKKLRFVKLGPIDGKPILLDDTCYFIGFDSEHELDYSYQYFTSEEVTKIILSQVFWDEMRPITAKMLNSIPFSNKNETQLTIFTA